MNNNRGQAPNRSPQRPQGSAPNRPTPPRQQPSGQRRPPMPNQNRPSQGQVRPTPERRPYPSRPPMPKRKRASAESLFTTFIVLLVVLVALIITYIIIKAPDKPEADDNTPTESTPTEQVGGSAPIDDPLVPQARSWVFSPTDPKAFIPVSDSSTVSLAANAIYSNNIIMLDAKTGKVICEYQPDTKIYPASMTKIMTAIVACDLIEDMNDTFVLTNKIVNPLYNDGASMAQFKIGVEIPMIDLIYGALLPSGADATAALAISLCGSEEEFVKKMNEKAAEIGCTKTNFVNASGLHDKNHYSTVRDIATIMTYAMNNSFLRIVMSAGSYTPKAALNDGYKNLKSTWYGLLGTFASDKATMFAAKTGYTPEAGNCLASISKTEDGREYIIISAGAYTTNSPITGKNQAFADVKKLCDTYIK